MSDESDETKCPTCGGSGLNMSQLAATDCAKCAGSGWLSPDYPVEPTPGGVTPSAEGPAHDLPWSFARDALGGPAIDDSSGGRVATFTTESDARLAVRAVNALRPIDPSDIRLFLAGAQHDARELHLCAEVLLKETGLHDMVAAAKALASYKHRPEPVGQGVARERVEDSDEE
jgi:hypothetical protein